MESSTDGSLGSSGGGGGGGGVSSVIEESGETSDQIQLEPTKDEMERERLVSRLEQVYDIVVCGCVCIASSYRIFITLPL